LLLLAGGAQAADIFKGREIYELHCQSCHGIDGSSLDPGTPDFTRGESLFVPDSDLVRRLRDGSAMKPAYRGLLTDEEMRDVIAYVRTLQR
jgi:mono/diheme cytochrome c family protein